MTLLSQIFYQYSTKEERGSMKDNIQQFLYELFFGRDINNQWTYMHKKPYQDGFYKGMEAQNKSIRSMINLCMEHKKKYPKVVTDSFIVEVIKKMSV